ncbi:hypothetical protein NAEGRDRAFT_77974 [Naegleria gruberi]|uniref:Uncharacterized protein n=1 Tax=Naegleria gruberi TaxID=5762 RepID=D2UZU8_NAEGR|nr:uncharacterized protein NAEGRDRAFT_77974 [Naegleria gruberi]EFC50225.1 hypothetical protein NAEGRDRAFT_77974 [Naegleria gruberi]|eukprot:XP_002682969.1 hypothetical protein NAEGRDRAFT_77974 [Naegleria gruberi strain NEG-M]
MLGSKYQQDDKTKIEWIVESLLEELIEQNLKDLCSSIKVPSHIDSSNDLLLNTTTISFQNNNIHQEQHYNSNISSDNKNNGKVPFLSNILINEQGLKLKIILFKRIIFNEQTDNIIDRNNRLGITIAFLTEGFYECELLTVFDTEHTLLSLQNKIQQEYNQVVENDKSTTLIQPASLEEQYSEVNKKEFSNSREESFVLDFVFSHLVEPVADAIIPLYNRLFSHCKKSNLLLRNNLILVLPDILEDINNREYDDNNLFAILFHNITSQSCVPLQYFNPTAIKSPILIIRMLNRESFLKIQNRGLTRYLLQEGFNNATFPTTYWNSFSKRLNQSLSNYCNSATYKVHQEKAQQECSYQFKTLSQVTDFMITDTTDYGSFHMKIGSDIYPQSITVSLSLVSYEVTVNIPSGVHEYLVRSLCEENSKQYQHNGILINCGVHREFFQDFGYLLSDGSIFTRNNSGKCSNYSFSSLRFDWCFDLQRDEIEFDKDTLVVKCCAKTMEDLVTSLYYKDDFIERTIYSNKSHDPNFNGLSNGFLFMIKWNKSRSIYYYQHADSQAIPIDYDLFSLSGMDYFDRKEFKYKQDHKLSCSIEQIVLLSPPIHFSTRITANNMVKLVDFVFNTFSSVLSKNPTLPLEILDRFDIVVNCLDYGCVTFGLNSYYEKNFLSSKLKKEWIDRHLNVRKVLKEFISNEQLFSFVGPKLSFSIHFQLINLTQIID